MSSNLIEQCVTLRALLKADPGLSKRFVAKSNRAFIDAVSECACNILSGRVKLNPKQKKRLARHKVGLRHLTNKKVSLKKKRVIIQKGGFLPAFLGPIIGILGKLLLSG